MITDGNEAIGTGLAFVADATVRLLADVNGLSEADAREPSGLPGWSRGHLLTHLARSADGMRNLLGWARTGIPTSAYPSRDARAAAIEAGAGRPIADLRADVAEAAKRWADDAAGMPAGAWGRLITLRAADPPLPASGIVLARLEEVEVHHVDLRAGYGFGDIPDASVELLLGYAIEVLGQRPGGFTVVATGNGREWPVGPPDPAGARVHGTAGEILGWLLGRTDGTGLRTAGGGALPPLPTWS
jgi:maleylpyruvate isomerase